MQSYSAKTDLEPVIWARLFQSQKREVSPEAARFLLSVEFGESDRARMLDLADRSESGVLTDEEAAEFDSYLRVGNLLAVMQSRARTALGTTPEASLGS